jgi:two-component system, sensor histidine kinase and response regulator
MDPLDEPVDVAALLSRVEGDRDLLEELVGLYLADESDLVGRIAQAVRAGDADSLRRAAHTLKGSIGNFCAPAAQAAASALETAGRDSALEPAPALLEQLIRELDRVRAALSALVARR